MYKEQRQFGEIDPDLFAKWGLKMVQKNIKWLILKL